MTTTNHWVARSLQWKKLGPPLQPNQEVIDCFHSLIPCSKHILLMGVTPQIANAYTNVTSVDREPAMIANVWPGNTDTKRVINDNWLTVDLPAESFDGVIGDGSINMLAIDDIPVMLERALTLLKPGGVFACRMFTRPDKPIELDQLYQEAVDPTVNFSAYKRLIPMYLAEIHGSVVPVNQISVLFDQMFPDRTSLSWTAEQLTTIDDYGVSDATTWFPTRDEILKLSPKSSRFIDVGTYDIADTCPILTFTK
jgi:SAM-dependent methyltransferase